MDTILILSTFSVALLLFLLLCAGLWLGGKLVDLKRRELAQRQTMRLHQLLAGLADPAISFPGKMAAAYELRRFTAHRELIFRTCQELRFKDDDELAQKIRLVLKESLDRLGDLPE